ncbi:STP1 protein [Plasmodium ovale curtisi]|uniref:STP1 protein n=1 Tax=Plasmodium ovale curtisi TaxID=864141 RepID=A0A1A8XCR3_PLAOA|nr:STP1 protein [Plasmodium ovale curtisi]
MDKRKNNCEDINKASTKVTNLVLLPYKTPILQGIIKIINEFKKNNDDGIDYKKLCEQTSRYVNAQKKCVQDVTISKGRTFVTKEWKGIISGLVQTYEKHDVKRLCYYEDDNEAKKKKEVLNIHHEFRNFCIEKKIRLQNLSHLNFKQCNEYMSWLNGKKMHLKSIDPNYEYIQQYQEYFNIHPNCNYTWLVSNIPDVTCSQITRTRGKEKEGAKKSVGDSSQTAPPIIPDSTTDAKKDNPLSPLNSFKGELGPASNKYPSSNPEIAPNERGSPPDNTNTVKDNVTPKIEDIGITGTDISKYPSNSYTKPNYADIKRFPVATIGKKIPYVIRFPIHEAPDIFIDGKPVQVQDIQIDPTAINSYTWIPLRLPSAQVFPPPYPRSKRFSSSNIHVQSHQTGIPPVEKYTRKTKPWRTPASFFYHELPPFIRSSTGKKEMEVVKIQLPIPDPSLFRSPIMIYILGFLILFTIIAMLFFLSKYTSFGLLFNKKKKKKRLKRNLEIKKIPEESPHFDNIDNHSIDDIPYENKIHDDKNIYNQLIIKKSVLKKNISIPQRKKNKRKAIIDIHMEILNECKNDEWVLSKSDFLEIILEEFIREQNKIHAKSEKFDLKMKTMSTPNAKEAKMLLWDKWAEKYKPIWENFKRGNTFKLLQYRWKKEDKTYLDNTKAENNIFNENEKIPLREIKKDIWRNWITKQATLIQQYKEEKWLKSLVEELEYVSDEYKKGKIKDDIFVVNIKELENKENNEELYKRVKHIFLIKVLIQILMMVIEECIKEESSGKMEIVLDNLIEKLNKEKHAKIESENIHQENMNHKEYNEMLEQHKSKDEDSFNQLLEG